MDPSQPNFESNYPRESYQSGLPLRPPGVYFDTLSTAFQILRSGTGVFVFSTVLTLLLYSVVILAQWLLFPAVTLGTTSLGSATGNMLLGVAIGTLSNFLTVWFGFTIQVGIAEATRNILLGREADAKHLFVGFRRFGRIGLAAFVGSVAYGILFLPAALLAKSPELLILGFAGSSLLLLVLGIFLFGSYSLTPFSLYYGKDKAVTDLIAPVRRLGWSGVLLSVLIFLASLVSSIGVFACGIGFLFTAPILGIVGALHYFYNFPENVQNLE